MRKLAWPSSSNLRKSCPCQFALPYRLQWEICCSAKKQTLTNVTTWSRPDWDSRSSQSSATIFAIFIWLGSEVFKVHLPILQSDAWIRPQLSMGCEDPAWRRHLYSWNLWSSFGVLILYWQLCDVAISFILFFRGTCIYIYIYIHIHVEHMYIPSGNFT